MVMMVAMLPEHEGGGNCVLVTVVLPENCRMYTIFLFSVIFFF